MRRLAIFAVAISAFAAGCQKTTVTGAGDKKMDLIKPTNQTIKVGETDQINVMIVRKNFRDPVKITFDNLPKGVEVQDKDLTIAAEKNSATFTIRADANAAPADKHNVTVNAEAPGLDKATANFELTVKAKD